MKKLTIFLTQILACGLLAVLSSAQFIPQATAIPGSAPEGINYQGRLEDGGFPVNGTKSMIFRVHSAPVGGVLLWTSPAQAVPVALGLFSAVVPVPTTVLVGGGARYLEVQIDSTLMAPRELLNSVPYALIAKSVEGNIDVSTAGLAINANSTAVQPALYISSVTGNVGVGTGAPITAFDVGGSAQFGSGATKSTFSATGALDTAGRITAPDYSATYGISASTAVFTYVLASSVTTTGNINVQGNVGIGTTSPASKLHVLDGDIRVSTSIGQPSKGIVFQDGSVQTTAAGGTGGGWTDTGAVVQLVTPTDTIGSTGAGVTISTHLVVSAGNVGIGTASPSGPQRLEVAGTQWNQLALSNSAEAGSGAVKAFVAMKSGTPDSYAHWGLNRNPSTGLFGEPGKTEASITLDGLSNDSRIRFHTSPTNNVAALERMRVDKDGNVGIGTTGPQARLSVSDVNSSLIFASKSFVEINNEDSTANNTFGVAFRQNDTGGLRQTVANLDVIGASHAPGAQSGILAFGTRNLGSYGERLRIDSAGNVGIGTTNPASLLHLYNSGNAILSVDKGGAGAQSQLSFKAAGVADWTIITETAASPNLAILDSGSNRRLSLTQAGNVGIGTTNPAVALDVKDQGEFGLGAFTQAQVNAKIPGKVGTLILNSSINQVCVSTGTTIMGYAKIRDGATCQ